MNTATKTTHTYRPIGSILTSKEDGVLSKRRILTVFALALFFVLIAFIAITVF
jgi:hypothetical protein